MTNEDSFENLTEEEKQNFMQAIAVRALIQKYLKWGVLWFGASLGAVIYMLGTTTGGVLWYGGILVGVVYFFRAGKIFNEFRKMGVGQLTTFEKVLSIIAAGLILVAALIVAPEAYKSYVPGVGTCWADKGDKAAIVACWSPQAVLKTSGYSANESDCGLYYLYPDATETRYTCLEPL